MKRSFIKIGYIPELDGIRGIAIIIVMLYHGNENIFSGGFIGVDIFFVISGFLITSLLIKEYNKTNTINLKQFYIRRILRLFPALLLLIIILIVFCFVFLDFRTARGNFIDSFITLFYMSNWARAFGIHPPNFLGHTWSLSIEEQFYIMWPIALFWFIKVFKSTKKIIISVLFLALISWLIRYLMILNALPFIRLYNGLDTRAESLLLGAVLGVFLSLENITNNIYLKKYLSLSKYFSLAAVFILVFISFLGEWKTTFYFLWLMPLVEILSIILILDIFSENDTILKKFLRGKVLVWIGGLSYGLYLWHYPVFHYLQMYLYFNWITIITVGSIITFLIASVSYYSFERPFLKLKVKFSYIGKNNKKSDIQSKINHERNHLNLILTNSQNKNLNRNHS